MTAHVCVQSASPSWTAYAPLVPVSQHGLVAAVALFIGLTLAALLLLSSSSDGGSKGSSVVAAVRYFVLAAAASAALATGTLFVFLWAGIYV